MDTGIGALRTSSKVGVYKTAKFIGNKNNKNVDAVSKWNDDKIVTLMKIHKNQEKRLEKREEILNKLKHMLYKWNSI